MFAITVANLTTCIFSPAPAPPFHVPDNITRLPLSSLPESNSAVALLFLPIVRPRQIPQPQTRTQSVAMVRFNRTCVEFIEVVTVSSTLTTIQAVKWTSARNERLLLLVVQDIKVDKNKLAKAWGEQFGPSMAVSKDVTPTPLTNDRR